MKRRLIAVVLAGVLALFAGAATVLYVARSNDRAVAGQEPVEVWLTMQPVPRGTTLGQARSDGLIRPDRVPARSVPANVLRDLGDDTLVAMSDIAAGEVLLTGRFGDETAQGPQALTVPAGHVAASVKVEDPQRVGPFVKPGDFVALFFSDGVSARVVFSRVQVLGVGAESERTAAKSDDEDDEEKDDADKGVVLTLSVTDVEAATLVTMYSAVLNDDNLHLHFALLPANEDVAPGTAARMGTR